MDGHQTTTSQIPNRPVSPTPQPKAPTREPPTPSHRPRDAKMTRLAEGAAGTQEESRDGIPFPPDITMDPGGLRNTLPLPFRRPTAPSDVPKQETLPSPDDDPFRTIPFPKRLLDLSIPEHRVDNPHFHTVNSEDFPAPENTEAGFTEGEFQRLVISANTILKNVAAGWIVPLLEKEDVVIIIPFGADRKKLLATDRQIHSRYQEFIRSTWQKDTEDVVVYQPDIPTTLRKDPKDHQTPFYLIACGVPEYLRNFLVNRQTIAAKEDITFHAITPSRFREPWVICYYNGNHLTSTPKAVSSAIKAIQQACWKDKQLWTIIAKARSLQKRFKTDAEMMTEIMATWDILYTEGVSEGRMIPNYILTGVPITDKLCQKAFVNRIKSMDSIYDGPIIIRAKTNKFNSCTDCKSDTHQSASCPFPCMVGWLGPTPNSEPKRKAPSSFQRKERDAPRDERPSRGGRGSRGSRGSNRGSSRAHN
jgi:hypothetical protein